MVDTNAELLPCPFCGGEASQFAAYITCKKCRAELQTAYAIDTPEKWNTRVALPKEKVSLRDAAIAIQKQYSGMVPENPSYVFLNYAKAVLDAAKVEYES